MARKQSKFSSALTQTTRRLCGEVQRLTGSPVSELATPRLALEQWLQALRPSPSIKGRILISALRNNTWTEWAVYAACVLRQMGYASTLLYSGEVVSRLYPQRVRSLNFWAGVPRIPDLELLDLDAMALRPETVARLRPAAQRAAPAALAYDLHVEEEDVSDPTGPHGARLADFVERTARMGAALDAYLRGRSFHRFLCYSGLISESALLLQVAKEHSLTTVCLEGWAWRPGHMIYNFDSPAMEYNVPGWLRALGPWDPAKEAEINAYLKFLDGERQGGEWLNNFYAIQKAKVSAELPRPLADFLSGDAPVFVLAPNVIGDSSMLRRETIFGGQQSWTREVIRYFRDRPDRKLVIRAHPAEVWVGSKCTIHMGPLATVAAEDAPNIFIIDSTAKLNTFSLLPFARAGLVWLSSVGVDMVVRGVPVVAAARPKYEGLGVVAEPAGRGEYFALLDRWSRVQERPGPEQIAAGKRYLYLTFKGFSFEAGGRDYHATTCRLNGMPNQADHDRFFRILVGEEPAPDRMLDQEYSKR